MNDQQALQTQLPDAEKPVDLSRSTIRVQLLWASLFPLAFFCLLSMLVISSALNRMSIDLVSQRNAAQAQILADSLARDWSAGAPPTTAVLSTALQQLQPVSGSYLYVIDSQGRFIASSETGADSLPLLMDDLLVLTRNPKPSSQLMESTVTLDQVMVSFAALADQGLKVVIIEPWAANMTPAFYYQLVLAGLLGLGIALSLGMLSLSIGRVIRPIGILAEHAAEALPGSVFHPVPTHGPLEIRRLIDAFNQMVIRLAEQQTALRQYAHKALLSQEEERQRFSHELHDGTLQDLLSLAQRVELCRNELERDPPLARLRLDELHTLLRQSIDNVRRISNALRPPVLEDLGLPIALDALCKDLRQDKPALHCEYSVSGEARRLQPELELAVYRVVQEALTNVRKHAQNASLVEVDLNFGDAEIHATVKNDGAVFANRNVESSVRSGHLGLAGMYERTRLFGGTLTIDSDPNGCTVVSLQLPCSYTTLT